MNTYIHRNVLYTHSTIATVAVLVQPELKINLSLLSVVYKKKGCELICSTWLHSLDATGEKYIYLTKSNTDSGHWVCLSRDICTVALHLFLSNKILDSLFLSTVSSLSFLFSHRCTNMHRSPAVCKLDPKVLRPVIYIHLYMGHSYVVRHMFTVGSRASLVCDTKNLSR